MSIIGNRINTRSQSQRIPTSQENSGINHDFTPHFSASQTVSDATTIASRPTLLTGSQSMFNTNMPSSIRREPEFQHSIFPRPSMSWSMGDTNSREHETLRDSNTRNVDSCMQEMKRKMEHLEGTFFSVTDQLKNAIEGLRPSNSSSQVDSARERENSSGANL